MLLHWSDGLKVDASIIFKKQNRIIDTILHAFTIVCSRCAYTYLCSDSRTLCIHWDSHSEQSKMCYDMFLHSDRMDCRLMVIKYAYFSSGASTCTLMYTRKECYHMFLHSDRLEYRLKITRNRIWLIYFWTRHNIHVQAHTSVLTVGACVTTGAVAVSRRWCTLTCPSIPTGWTTGSC